MPYRLKRKETVAEGIRRVVGEEVQKAARELADENPDIHEGIHNARKSFKKCRSVLRLVRDALGGKRYKAENRWFRDAKNRLSSARDAEAMIETFDKLAERYPTVGSCQLLGTLREGLLQRRQRIAEDQMDLEQTARATAEQLREFEARIGTWDFSRSGFDALEPGFARMYRRGRKAMRKAYRQPSDENFHEWRKRVKDHWYHCRLLRNLWPATMRSRVSDLGRLSDLLGDDHDLGVLCHVLKDGARDLQGDADALICLAQGHQAELRAQARPLGESLYEEKPARLASALRSHWQTWKKS